MKKIFIAFALIFNFTTLPAQITQIGSKIVSSDIVGTAAGIGVSISLSSDGKTALVGAPYDNSNIGAAFIYTFNGTDFVQAGNKLVGTGGIGAPGQGAYVSLSPDGKTALVGASGDDSNKGAAWIYTFNGNNFVQVGNKLVGSGMIGSAKLGLRVAISTDGKTALVGGLNDNSYYGAVWVFTFNGTDFVQAGNKLVGTGGTSTTGFGSSICISSDGNTALIGGFYDNGFEGAVWVFTFNGTNFVQAGPKLVGTGAIDGAQQGYSISLSENGKTALIGGVSDDSAIGAVWVFTFNGNNYEQAGNKLVGSGAIGGSRQSTVSLSANGKIALVGGYCDNSNVGAVWVYTFNGTNYVQAGNKIVGTGYIGAGLQGNAVSLSADGSIALVGAPLDNIKIGAFWAYKLAFSESITGDNSLPGANTNPGINTLAGITNSIPGVNTLTAIVFTTTSPVLHWSKTMQTLGYCVQLSVDQSFNSLLFSVCGITDTFYVLPANLMNTGRLESSEYYWRVSSTFSLIQGDWSKTGSFTFTDIDDISNSIENQMNFEVYPNPSKGSFTISIKNFSTKNEDCVVYNYLGQFIASLQPGESHLPKGLYLVRYGKESRKLIIE